MRRVVLVALALAIVFALPGGAFAEEPVKLGSVSGAGRPIADGFDYSFTFTAVQTDSAGNAKGQMQWVASSGQRVHADVLYLWTDLETNRAWIGAVVSKSDAPSLPVGLEYVFEVVDGGEGSNAAGPDKATLRYYNTTHGAFEAVVLGFLGWDLSNWWEWTSGNIQIRSAVSGLTVYPG